jgi:hypothetical protein
MKGHLRERSPGHWAIILDLPDDTGQRKRKWHSFRGTKRQAQDECAKLIAALKAGSYVELSKENVAAYLERWLADVKSRVSPRTHERYAQHATSRTTGGTRKKSPLEITRSLGGQKSTSPAAWATQVEAPRVLP